MSRIFTIVCLIYISFTSAGFAQGKVTTPAKIKVNEAWKKGRGSMRYKLYRSGDTLRVREGALVKLHLAWYAKTPGKASFDTRVQGSPSEFNTLPSPYPGSLEDGLFMMCKGDSAIFELQSDSMFTLSFGGKVPPEAANIQKVLVSIKLLDTDPRQTAEEREKQRKKYLEDNEERRKNEKSNIERFLYMNNINVERDSCGIWRKTLSYGNTARKPAYGDKVVFRMTGRALDGTIFEGGEDKPETKEFTIGKDPVPVGLSKGIQLLDIGEKALLIVPSELAFGSMHMGKLPPYSTLLLEVELLEIKPKKP